MELRHLRYFVRVAEELHFGRAAAQLGISQPPLSQQIRALEEELGVELLERSSRRVRLTEAGRLFLNEARRTLAQAKRAVEMAKRAQQGEVGQLAIGFAASAPFVPMIANALFAYRTAYPAVHLELVEMTRDAQIAAVAEQRLDAGFIRSFQPLVIPDSMVSTALLEEELLVAMRREHPLASRTDPLTISQLGGEPLVLYERNIGGGFNDHVAELFRAVGLQPNVVQEASGLATLLGLVAAGFGLTLLTRSLSALHLDDVTYRPLADARAASRLWFVHAREPSPLCRRFSEILSQSRDQS